jgi:NADPH:quinone reductase-like Zn-dependent oxidoreductase
MNLRAVFARNLSILGNYMGPLRGLRECVGLAETGKVRPVVGKTFPLGAAKEAQQCMLDRDFFGKIIVKVG